MEKYLHVLALLDDASTKKMINTSNAITSKLEDKGIIRDIEYAGLPPHITLPHLTREPGNKNCEKNFLAQINKNKTKPPEVVFNSIKVSVSGNILFVPDDNSKILLREFLDRLYGNIPFDKENWNPHATIFTIENKSKIVFNYAMAIIDGDIKNFSGIKSKIEKICLCYFVKKMDVFGSIDWK